MSDETSPPHILASGRGRCRASVRVVLCLGAGLSDAVIVPFAPAGTTDIAARLMGQWLSERLGQQFVIENRPGASTTIGTEAVVRAPADGYTLLLVSTASAINTTLFESKERLIKERRS
jgi:hypothetical protein